MNVRQSWAGALAVAGLLLASGCGAPQSTRAAAAGAAVRLLQAVKNGDGPAACDLLAPETAAALERDAGRPCPDAIGDEDLPDPAAVTGVDVDGQWAKVVVPATGGDGTLFLAMFPGGWRVAAAGCRARGERPYDCALQGG